jgi:hypothetical protein
MGNQIEQDRFATKRTKAGARACSAQHETAPTPYIEVIVDVSPGSLG